MNQTVENLNSQLPKENNNVYKYYSTQRPVSMGTFPNKSTLLEIVNYDSRVNVDEINRQAYGEITFSEPLTEKECNDYELVSSLQNDKALTENGISYFTYGLEDNSNQTTVTYQNLDEALNSYVNAGAIDGKRIGFVVNGTQLIMAHFDTVQMSNKIRGRAPRNSQLSETINNAIKTNADLLVDRLQQDNVYHLINSSITELEQAIVSNIRVNRSILGSWVGRVSNPDKPQDYFEMELTGYESDNTINLSIERVVNNESLHTIDYVINGNDMLNNGDYSNFLLDKEFLSKIRNEVRKMNTNYQSSFTFYSSLNDTLKVHDYLLADKGIISPSPSYELNGDAIDIAGKVNVFYSKSDEASAPTQEEVREELEDDYGASYWFDIRNYISTNELSNDDLKIATILLDDISTYAKNYLNHSAKTGIDKDKQQSVMQMLVSDEISKTGIISSETQNMLSDYGYAVSDFNRVIEKENVIENDTDKWNDFGEKPIHIVNRSGTNVYLTQEYLNGYTDIDNNSYKVYWGTINGEFSIILENSNKFYLYSNQLTSDFISNEVELEEDDLARYSFSTIAIEDDIVKDDISVENELIDIETLENNTLYVVKFYDRPRAVGTFNELKHLFNKIDENNQSVVQMDILAQERQPKEYKSFYDQYYNYIETAGNSTISIRDFYPIYEQSFHSEKKQNINEQEDTNQNMKQERINQITTSYGDILNSATFENSYMRIVDASPQAYNEKTLEIWDITGEEPLMTYTGYLSEVEPKYETIDYGIELNQSQKEAVLTMIRAEAEKSAPTEDKIDISTFTSDDTKNVASHRELLNTTNTEKEDTKMENNSLNTDTGKKTQKDIIFEQLETGVKTMLDSKQFANWCEKQGSIYYNRYSFRNAMLTYLQKPEATYVKGYEAWKECGRQVQQGAKSIKILMPVYATEQSKGKLFNSIKKHCNEDLAKTNNEFATYSLYQTGFSFNMYKNGLFDVLHNGTVLAPHLTSEQLRKFIDTSIIGKVPLYYSVGNVFDVSDTTDNVETLFVSPNSKGFKKEDIILGDDGKPQQNKRKQYLVRNTDERKARFNVTKMSMKIEESDINKMSILYDVLKSYNENKQFPVPVSESSHDVDKHLESAYGYYEHPTENYKYGRIVLRDNLTPTEKVSVLFHETAHSDLHRDVEKLVADMKVANKSDEEITVSKQLKEMQAEAVAYMTASNFGIKTDNKSFGYIARYSDGRDLKGLSKSLEVIYKESRKLMTDIEKELDVRGYDLSIESKDNTALTSEQKKEVAKDFISYTLNESRNVSEIQADALDELSMADDEVQTNLIKEQIVITQKIKENISKMEKLVDTFENSNTKDEQDGLICQLKAIKEQSSKLSDRINVLSEERVNSARARAKEVNTDTKALYVSNPTQAMEELKKKYTKMQNYDSNDIKYLATSKFISKEYGKLLGKDNNKFVAMATTQLEHLKEVMSKNNKTAVEITSCEKWGEQPVFVAGTVLHPKVANQLFAKAEKQIEKFIKKAKSENDHCSFTKCNVSIYSVLDNGKLSVMNTTVDIGDSTQKDLKDHLNQLGSRGKEKVAIRENFINSTRERSEALLLQPAEEKDVRIEMSVSEKANIPVSERTMDDWTTQIKEYMSVKEFAESQAEQNETEISDTHEETKVDERTDENEI